MTTTAVDFATPITTISQAKTWIETLHAAEMMFHFEDSPDDIINGSTGEALFTDEQAEQVSERVAELYSFDWATFDCPIGYALNVMQRAEFAEAGFVVEAGGGNTVGWMRLTADGSTKVLITNSDGDGLDLRGADDFFAIGAYSVETGDPLLDDGLEDGDCTATDAIAKAKEVAAQFGGF